jgi:hypothetical protein
MGLTLRFTLKYEHWSILDRQHVLLSAITPGWRAGCHGGPAGNHNHVTEERKRIKEGLFRRNLKKQQRGKKSSMKKTELIGNANRLRRQPARGANSEVGRGGARLPADHHRSTSLRDLAVALAIPEPANA